MTVRVNTSQSLLPTSERNGRMRRLGVFSDLLYRRDSDGLSSHQAFIRFITSLPPRVDEVVIFGRVKPAPERAPYALPEQGVRFVELPHYPRITAVGAQLRAYREARETFERELGQLDVAWIFGPHPVAVGLARSAARSRTPLVLGIRQDYPSYIRHRLPSRRWAWAIPVAHALEWEFRRMSRRHPSVALGHEIASAYAGGAPVLETGFPLISANEIADLDAALDRSWDGELRVLSVGRIDAEKNPLLLVEIAKRLRERSPDWKLVVVGEGPLLEQLGTRRAQEGLEDCLVLQGHLKNGPELWNEYRRSHVFLHVSLTEGLPQVLAEAQSVGLPIVATAVGGVPGVIDHERNGLLIHANSAEAAVEALERFRQDEKLRRSLVTEGLRRARTETMETQLDQVATFLRNATSIAA